VSRAVASLQEALRRRSQRRSAAQQLLRRVVQLRLRRKRIHPPNDTKDRKVDYDQHK
jgi:uncharacterized protein (DUF2342 family)